MTRRVRQASIASATGRVRRVSHLVGDLATLDDRIEAERLALRIAVGSARRRVVLSYSRVDAEQARPRVPSFYGLEVLRAVEGRLPSFEALARSADRGGATRLGWPAPEDPADAIDEAEHDLALLARLVRPDAAVVTGAARYLITSNQHLARALRHRAMRWDPSRWTYADGLVKPDEAARVALAAHALAARSYSPTALQGYAACPYRFVLHAIHKLAPREEPVAIEKLDPLDRGSLVHEILFQLLSELRDARPAPDPRRQPGRGPTRARTHPGGGGRAVQGPPGARHRPGVGGRGGHHPRRSDRMVAARERARALEPLEARARLRSGGHARARPLVDQRAGDPRLRDQAARVDRSGGDVRRRAPARDRPQDRQAPPEARLGGRAEANRCSRCSMRWPSRSCFPSAGSTAAA